MKRAFIHIGAALMLSFGLTFLLWLGISSQTKAATIISTHDSLSIPTKVIADFPTEPAHFAPSLIPMRNPLTIPVNIVEPFAVNPLTQSVTIDFDAPADINLFQGIAHDSNHPATPSIVNYNNDTNDTDTELSISHKSGRINVSTDEHYAYYLKKPLANLSEIQVQILATNQNEPDARAGIELRNIGPTAATTDKTSKKIYFFINRSGLSNPTDYRIGAGFRVGSGTASGEKGEDIPTPSFRVHQGTAYKPIWLRIVRREDTYSFYFKDEGGTNQNPKNFDWQPLYITQTNTASGLRTYTKSIGEPLYLSLFGTAENLKRGNPANIRSGITYFDNLTYIITETLQVNFPAWVTKTYGTDTALAATPNTNEFGYLILQSDGEGVTQANDNTDSSGYALFHRQEAIQSEGGLEVVVQMHSAPETNGGMGGLELRTNPTADNSAKLGFGLKFNGTDYNLVAFSRLTNTAAIVTQTTTLTTATPVWLRITRDQSSNIFTFYYAQQAGDSQPATWTEYITTEVNLPNALFAGFFNASNSNDQNAISTFDNFRMDGAEIADEPISGLSSNADTQIILGQTLNFEASVTGGNNVEYKWNFGDGDAASGATISHTYTALGTYTATVTATNNISTVTASTVVTVTETPISGLQAINNGPVPPRPDSGFVTLSASVTAGSNVQYEWDLGDGNTAVGQVIENYRYFIFGENIAAGKNSFLATVTATNSVGSVSAQTEVRFADLALTGVNINKSPSVKTFVGVQTKLAAIPQPNPNTSNVWYSWDFGPKVVTPSQQILTGGRAENRVVFPIYNEPGFYTVKLVVTNTTNQVQKTVNIVVVPVPDVPITSLAFSSDGPTEIGNITTFQATVNPDSTNVFYEWDFGDDSPKVLSDSTTITHTYTSLGTYTPTVVASNNRGFLEEKTTVIVYGQPKPQVSKSGPKVVIVGQPFTYTLTVKNSGTDTLFDVTILDTLPDGVKVLSTTGDISNAVVSDGTVTWSKDVLYITETLALNLVASRDDSAVVVNEAYKIQGTDRLTRAVTQAGSPAVTTDIAYPPNAEAGQPQEVPPGVVVTLNGSGSSDPDNKDLTYFWEQLSGQSVSLNDPTAIQPTFFAPVNLGDLFFRLTVTNSSGLAATDQTFVKVSYEPIFAIKKTGPQEVNFGDRITYTIYLTNEGTAPASQLEIKDVIPNGANYVASAGGFNGGSLSNGTVMWDLNSLAVGEAMSFTLAITSNFGIQTIVNNQYSVKSAEKGPTTGDDVVVTTVKQNPLAKAGPDQTVLRNTRVILDGRQTVDPQGETLTYLWEQLSGPKVNLSNATAIRPEFTSPNEFGELIFKLTVTNETGLIGIDEIKVTVAPWTVVVGSSVPIGCGESETELFNKDAVAVRNPDSTIFIGYNKDAAGSRDPIAIKFTNGSQDWCSINYETSTQDDSSGYGLLWDGAELLYGVFNSFGDVKAGKGFNRYRGWIDSYISGSNKGGAGREVSVIGKISAATGRISENEEDDDNSNDGDGRATFLTGLDDDQRASRLIVTNLYFDETLSNLIIKAQANRAPRQSDNRRRRFACAGNGPFDYQITLSLNLLKALDASAVGCRFVPTAPDQATITGPTEGFPNRNYKFKTAYTPFDATTPLTITWVPEPASGQGTNLVSYSWPTIGQQTVTAKVYNEAGMVSATHMITIVEDVPQIISPTAVTIIGPITGEVGLPYTFTATVSPTTVNPPVLYRWSPEPQAGQGTDVVTYSWNLPGMQTVALTVENVVGSAATTYDIEIIGDPILLTAPTTVTISGPITAIISNTYQYAAQVQPTDAITPLTYTWSPQPESGQGTANVSYRWVSTGTQGISLTVSNKHGAANGNYTVTTIVSPTRNLPPLAVADVVTAIPGLTTTISVLDNDSDPEGDPLIVVSADPPMSGTVAVFSQTIVYSSADGFEGTDSFTYTITDGQGNNDAALVTVIVSTMTEHINLTAIDVSTDTTLVFTDINPTTNKPLTLTVQIPMSATLDDFVLVYTVLSGTTKLPPDGLQFGGQFFTLEAYVKGRLQRLTFTRPLTITLTYRDEEVENLLEETLEIRYWNETSQAWASDGIISTPFPDLNKVVGRLSHLTEFALFGQAKTEDEGIYLPIILR